MTDYDDLLKYDLEQILTGHEVAEEVTYFVNGQGGGIAIRAGVLRRPRDSDSFGTTHNEVEITVANDALTGVDQPTTRDYVTLPLTIGDGANKRFRVVEILEQDGGGWVLLCRGAGAV